MAQCSVCGAIVSEDETICPECGTDLGTTSEPVGVQVPSVPEPTAPAEVEAVPAPTAPPGAPPEGPRATLTLKRAGALTTERFEISGPVVCVGRFDPDSGPVDVDLSALPEATYVSRRHAEIRCDQAGNWFVRDLGSTNGTFLRSPGEEAFRRIVGEAEIKDGDELALGNARFEFHVGT